MVVSTAQLVLALLVAQNTATVLLMRYSQTRSDALVVTATPPPDPKIANFTRRRQSMRPLKRAPDMPKEQSTPRYRPTVAVLVAEVLKLVVSLAGAWWAVGSSNFCGLLRNQVLGSLDTLRCALPALTYTVQSNLLFAALANLDAPTFQVSYQTKVRRRVPAVPHS